MSIQLEIDFSLSINAVPIRKELYNLCFLQKFVTWLKDVLDYLLVDRASSYQAID